jgi:pilus assembly protein CpaC
VIKWRACRFITGQPDRSTKVVATNKNTVATHGRQLSRCRPCPLSLVFAVLIAAASLLSAGEARAQREIQLSGTKRTANVSVYIGKSEDVRTETSFVEITVGDPDVADVNPLTDRSLSILGKKSGTSRVSVYGEGKKLIGVFDVEVRYDTSMLASEIARRFPNAKLKVAAVNGKILISGDSPDGPTVDKAVAIAKQFGPDVINSVRVLQPQQVVLEVRFVEANRQASRELGVQWNVFANNINANLGNRLPATQLPVTPGGPNVSSTATTLSPVAVAGVLSGTAPFGVLVGQMVKAGLTTDVIINALEQKGLARSLAEPNLVALSGDTASFLAGGEFPVPVPGGLGTTSIEYKRYGVGLAFTPTVLSDGLINLKIEPEVSQLDSSHPVQVSGISVPPLIVRRASTTVELRDGQSFVIGGLLQSNGQNAISQLPWVGDIPVLGALFRSASYQKNETDLAIIVTPRLVRPSRPGDVIATPLDNSLPSNDLDLFLMGKVETPRATARLLENVQTREFAGHVLDLPKGGVDVSTVSIKN